MQGGKVRSPNLEDPVQQQVKLGQDVLLRRRGGVTTGVGVVEQLRRVEDQGFGVEQALIDLGDALQVGVDPFQVLGGNILQLFRQVVDGDCAAVGHRQQSREQDAIDVKQQLDLVLYLLVHVGVDQAKRSTGRRNCAAGAVAVSGGHVVDIYHSSHVCCSCSLSSLDCVRNVSAPHLFAFITNEPANSLVAIRVGKTPRQHNRVLFFWWFAFLVAKPVHRYPTHRPRDLLFFRVSSQLPCHGLGCCSAKKSRPISYSGQGNRRNETTSPGA